MSYDIVEEKVPSYVRRIGDQVIQGSNNTTIVLGTDRAAAGPAGLDDGLGSLNSSGAGKGAGSIYVVAGRQDSEGNPDLTNDLSYFYASMRTDVDSNLDLESIEKKADPSPAAIIKSDGVRVVARRDVKIVIDGSNSYIWLTKGGIVLKTEKAFVSLTEDKIVVEAGRIELGEGASQSIILGDSFKSYFLSHVHPTAAGLSGTPTNPWTDVSLLSQTSFVK